MEGRGFNSNRSLKRSGLYRNSWKFTRVDRPARCDKRNEANAVFTHADLTTWYRTKSLFKGIYVLSRSRDIMFYEED